MMTHATHSQSVMSMAGTRARAPIRQLSSQSDQERCVRPERSLCRDLTGARTLSYWCGFSSGDTPGVGFAGRGMPVSIVVLIQLLGIENRWPARSPGCCFPS
jgi:hypothetical protein